MTDQLFDYIEYISAFLAIALLLALLILKRRRDQLKDDVEEDGTTKEDFSSSMRSRMASMAAVQTAMPPADTNQSVSEEAEDELTYENIDVYSGTEEQDEAFDKETASYEEDVEHVEKSDSNAASISEFRLEDELLPDNLQQDVGIDKSGSAEFSNEIDFDLSDETDEGKKNLALDQTLSADDSMEEGVEFPDDSKSLKEANVSDYALEINFDESEQLLDSVNSNDKAVEKDKEGIDFELANSDIDLTEEESANEIEIPKMTAESSSFESNAERSGLSLIHI